MAKEIRVFNQSTGEYIEVEPIDEVKNNKTGKVVKVASTLHHHDAVRDAAAQEKEEEKKGE